MELIILMNGKTPEATGYDETFSLLQQKAERVVTYCPDFASFAFVDVGYRVRAIRTDEQTGMVSMVDLAELLQNNRPYTEKQIRPEHNVSKLIKSGAITFLPEITLMPSNPEDRALLNSLRADELVRFQTWFTELDQENKKQSNTFYSGQPLAEATGIKCWFDFFADGLSPSEALQADLDAE